MTQVTALRYEVVEGWEQLPAGYVHPDVPAVAVDSKDRVYFFVAASIRSWCTTGTGRSSNRGARACLRHASMASLSVLTTWSTAQTTRSHGSQIYARW
jgi:hypothetical protein